MRRQIKDIALNALASPDVRAVVSTAHKAVALLTDPTVRASVAEGTAPFTTIIIDEAGLIPRALAAVLSLLASDRVLLVGDPKQLAPISKISRILPTSQAVWLGSCPLSHLDDPTDVNPGVHLLREQYRMHPEVSRVVSAYQYGGQLRDAAEVRERRGEPPGILAGQPRAIWYVLDEDTDDLPSIRAERGPGNRSWVRPRTRAVLKKLFGDGTLGRTRGLFVTPFAAQARDISAFLAGEDLEAWASATVHSHQGMEAECVIFDTVNAGSTGWAYDEWKRLVNVGLSRAREFVIVLASRAEMREPYLRGLSPLLEPRVLRKSGRSLVWAAVPIRPAAETAVEVVGDPDSVGHQIAMRKLLRPVMSLEQQRLCGLKMDGKPRLVRGVAGSGKTVVLAHWLQKTLSGSRASPTSRSGRSLRTSRSRG